ncbi:MAG TPA: TMEM175 family protein [Dongiaceae bacterium]|nr:TMEM175 family protein [Dongiaceae bacterium]
MRGARLTRIDIFSNAIFAFALALLVLSLEVPRTFAELRDALSGFLPFAACFTILLVLWYSHYLFFRRYGLHDQVTILFNSALLFIVLFYIYPLRFLFGTLFVPLRRGHPQPPLSNSQLTELLLLCAIGFIAVCFLLASLYGNAWRQRSRLALNGVERLLTIHSILDCLGLAAVGFLAGVAAWLLPARFTLASVYLYFLIVPWKALSSFYFGRKARNLRALVAAPNL